MEATVGGKVRTLLVGALIPLVLGAAVYAAYIVAGGQLGRERLKAVLALRGLDYTYEIDASGGDCDRFGTWDAGTLTCSLSGDLSAGENIRIAADGVTLDGGGHTMSGDDGSRTGVVVVSQRDVRIRNLELKDYFEGILLQNTTESRLHDLRIHNTASHTIHLEGESNFNMIVDNDLGPTQEWHGVSLYWSHGNLIAGNDIRGTQDAVRLQSSTGNVVTMNYTTESIIEGIDVHLSAGNSIFMNDLFEAVAAPILDDTEEPGANLFAIRYGGNYTTQFDSSDEGCFDADADGICDEAFAFFRDSDPKALTAPVTPRGMEEASDSDTETPSS